MAVRYPIEYDLTPENVEGGRRWMTLTLKNIGDGDLVGLDVRMNSLDTFSISVYGTGSYIAVLKPGEQQQLPFQILANSTASVYVTADGWDEGVPFHWESPGIPVTVGNDVAELVSLFALTEPYPLLGQQIRCEATVRGIEESEGLTLEFWVETASGEFQGLTTLDTQEIAEGQIERFETKMMPEAVGLHTIHAYLYDGVRRIGHALDHVYVTDTQITQPPEMEEDKGPIEASDTAL